MLLGLGNPLLDISANADDSLLTKYGLEANNAILAEEKHMPLYEELVKSGNVEYIAGGATQNAIRVAQWIIAKPQTCSFFGSVGKDKYSETLEKKATEAGVQVKYQFKDEHPTGTCAVIVTKNGTCRSLVANLAAANHFNKSHLDVPENRKIIEEAKFYYISGFFLTVSPDSILEIGSHASTHNKVFGMNLSAPFLCEFFTEPMMKAFPHVDYLFGNETEAAKFAEIQKFDTTDIKKIALKAAELPKSNNKRTRTVIFTQGAENVIVAKDGEVKEFPVIKLSADKLIDTNGAGDAFAGGFLAQLVQGKPLEECIRCAIWAATEIIQLSGCTCPENITYKPAQ